MRRILLEVYNLAVWVKRFPLWVRYQLRDVLADELIEAGRAVGSISREQLSVAFVIALGALDRAGENASHRDSGTACFCCHGHSSARRSPAGSVVTGAAGS